MMRRALYDNRLSGTGGITHRFQRGNAGDRRFHRYRPFSLARRRRREGFKLRFQHVSRRQIEDFRLSLPWMNLKPGVAADFRPSLAAEQMQPMENRGDANGRQRPAGTAGKPHHHGRAVNKIFGHHLGHPLRRQMRYRTNQLDHGIKHVIGEAARRVRFQIGFPVAGRISAIAVDTEIALGMDDFTERPNPLSQRLNGGRKTPVIAQRRQHAALSGGVAQRLGVGVEFITFATPGELADAVGDDVWDIGNIGAEPERAKTIAFTGEGADRKVPGTVRIKIKMAVNTTGETSELVVDSEANIMGKLGEFGQGIIKRKADGIMKDFGKNLTKRVEGS